MKSTRSEPEFRVLKGGPRVEAALKVLRAIAIHPGISDKELRKGLKLSQKQLDAARRYNTRLARHWATYSSEDSLLQETQVAQERLDRIIATLMGYMEARSYLNGKGEPVILTPTQLAHIGKAVGDIQSRKIGLVSASVFKSIDAARELYARLSKATVIPVDSKTDITEGIGQGNGARDASTGSPTKLTALGSDEEEAQQP